LDENSPIGRTSFNPSSVGIFLLALVFSFTSQAQFSDGSFQFINSPVSARINGLGGVNVSLADRDPSFVFSNPALVGDTLSGVASASYQFYVGDIGHAGITFSKDFSKAGMLTFGVQHMNYGTIQGYDASGNELSSFNPSETALLVSRSHQVENFRIGGTFKGIFANYSGVNASAVAVDIGGVWFHPTQKLTVGMTIKNAGVVISDFSSAADSRLPFDVQLGATFKPQHMPIRFSLTAYNLANKLKLFDEEAGTVEKVLAHASFGAEVLLHRNVNLLAGYNYLKHSELKLENAGGTAGVTLGVSLAIKKFDFVFSRAAFTSRNAVYSFTLSRNMASLF
jgi:hypothetical protein